MNDFTRREEQLYRILINIRRYQEDYYDDILPLHLSNRIQAIYLREAYEISADMSEESYSKVHDRSDSYFE